VTLKDQVLKSEEERAARFFKIVAKLLLELQMVFGEVTLVFLKNLSDEMKNGM